MPTHLIDSQLARFRANPLEPFDKVNIGLNPSWLAVSYNRRTWRMLLIVTTSVVEYYCLHNTNKKSLITIIVALLELNLQLHSDEAYLDFHDSIHAPFSAVHLKWSKDCIIQLAISTCSRELAGSLVVALKLRNIKVGYPAHVRCNYNLLILLCSFTKIKCHCGDSDGSSWKG